MVPPKLPNFNEFSPGSGVELRRLLDIVNSNPGDRTAQLAGVIAAFPRIAATSSSEQRAKRAANVLIGMSQCGLADIESHELTELGKALFATTDDDELHEKFALHLIQECHGDTLIDAIGMISDRGDRVTAREIRKELRSRGFKVTENSGDASKLKLWLAQAGIFNATGWGIDDTRLNEVIGLTTGGLAEWRALTRAQRAFLAELRNQVGDADGWVNVRPIKSVCEAHHGREVFPEGQLRSKVINPLEEEGWLEARGTGSGRGGDSGDVRATKKLKDVQLPFVFDDSPGIPRDLRAHLRTPLANIIADLRSTDRNVKGLALELLALRLVRDLGLHAVSFRLRSAATGGAEVDLIADQAAFHYSRWLVQCKNTGVVKLSDVAKEVGMATVIKANVVLMVTTGNIASTAVDYANGVADATNLQVVLLDKSALNDYRNRGSTAVIDRMREQARTTRQLKAQHLDDELVGE